MEGDRAKNDDAVVRRVAAFRPFTGGSWSRYPGVTYAVSHPAMVQIPICHRRASRFCPAGEHVTPQNATWPEIVPLDGIQDTYG